MANSVRIIFLMALLFSSAVVNAAFPKQPYWQHAGGAPGQYPSAAAACEAVANWWTGSNGVYTVTAVNIISGGLQADCIMKRVYNGSTTNGIAAQVDKIGMGCPENSDEVNGSCVCKEEFSEYDDNGVKSCKADADTDCEQAGLQYNVLGNDRATRVPGKLPLDVPSIVCYVPEGSEPGAKGCKHQFTADFSFENHKGEWFSTGISWALDDVNSPEAEGSLSCSPGEKGNGEPKESNDNDEDCARGYKGEVNGVEVCIDAQRGNTEGTDWTRTTDTSGKTIDTKRTVSCDRENCTVTEVKKITNSNGTPGATTTTTTENVNRRSFCADNPKNPVCGGEEDRTGSRRGQSDQWGGPDGTGGQGGQGGGGNGEGNGFCEENPDSPICKEGTFGGSCAAGFQCDGDAIQCSIAREQHMRNCKLFDDESPESQLYSANKDKTGDQTLNLPGNETVDLGNRIDMSDALGGGSGVSDLMITVGGQSITLPFSQLNSILAALGNVLVAISFLIALRVIGRG